MTQIQVSKENYNFPFYVTKERWSSYWQQIYMAYESGAKSILVVGVGDSIAVEAIKTFCHDVTTFDFDETLNPDIVGDIRNLDTLLERKFDLIICCQVLEHLPYTEFVKILKLMKKVSDNLVLSLPYRHWRILDIKIKIPRIKRFSISLIIPKFFEDFKFNGQHYWEVGTKGYSRRRVLEDIRSVFKNSTQVKFNDYHYHAFYECKLS